MEQKWTGREKIDRLRPLDCDYCKKITIFSCGAWLHCTVCKRCYTCLALRTEKCELCVKYDEETKKIVF